LQHGAASNADFDPDMLQELEAKASHIMLWLL
jgi:hypothetical protein